MSRYLLLALCTLFFTGCEQNKQTTAPSPQSPPVTTHSALLQTPSQPLLMELPSEAITHWRNKAKSKPALVIFSNNPMLVPIPVSIREAALKLSREGSTEQLRQQGSFFAADPLLLPTQVTSAALALDLISEIYWVYPGGGTVEEIDHVAMRDALANQTFVTPEESAHFTNSNGIVSGIVRGIPLHLVHPEAIPKIKQPVLLHIDLSYLTALYRNEEGTPAYDLLLGFASKLRAQNLKVQKTTLSFSNIEGNVPLDLRFLMTDLAQILRQPELIDAPLPKPWQLRAEGLAQTTLLQHDKAFAFYRQAQELSPNDASVQFDLYLSFSALKKPQQALAALDRAVTLDRGYFFEYLNLAAKVIPQGGLVEGIALMEKAIENMDDPGFVLLQSVSTHLEAGHSEEAQKLFEQAKRLPWSSAYHADVNAYLPTLQKQIDEKTN